MFKFTQSSKYVFPNWPYAGDGDGTGEGTGEDPPAGGQGGGADLDAKIAEAVKQATAGLTANRDQILVEKKQLSDQVTSLATQMESLGGKEGIEAMVKMREQLSNDEVGKLLAEGKYEEWYETRTSSMKGEHERQLTALSAKLEESDAARKDAVTQYTNTLLETEVRAACVTAELLDTAHMDALLNARNTFAFDPELKKFIRQNASSGTVYGKDGVTPQTVSEWLEEQKDISRHWWPASQGAGANGGHGGGGSGDIEPDAEAISKMSMPEYNKYRESKGLGQYKHGIPG